MKFFDHFMYTDIGGRAVNEDSADFLQVNEKTWNAILADGLGGQGDGQEASSLVCRELRNVGADGSRLTEEALTECIVEANAELMHHQRNKFHMKTTVVFLRIEGDTALWGHIGDSRLYHFYEGKLVDYTLDHSVSQLAVFMGQITRDQIPGHSGRSRLIHAMGSEDESPDVHQRISLQPGKHSFLLCSDGYWEYLSDEEIAMSLNKASSAKQWHKNMLWLIKQRCPAETDNRTAITIFAEV